MNKNKILLAVVLAAGMLLGATAHATNKNAGIPEGARIVSVEYVSGIEFTTLVLSTGQPCVLTRDQSGSFFMAHAISCDWSGKILPPLHP